MGCDGGTIPKRDELVKTKKKPEQKDKDAELHCKWRLCSVTQETLKAPIVACEMGKLYNKDVIIEMLLDKSKMVPSAQHIRNLKDVKELNLTTNPSYGKGNSAAKGDTYVDTRATEYICPIIGLDMNGKFRFSFLWSCGCVMSEKAVKEIKSTVCHKCQKPFSEEDVIVLNPADDELTAVKERMEARRAKAKADKRTKAVKRSGEEDVAAQTSAKANGKKLKAADNKSKFPHSEASKMTVTDPALVKMSSSYSVAKDAANSEVYKSLFTSHPTAQKKPTAHWVTFNPFYN
nr:EOG090X0ACT [Triops cancriformis]